MVNRWIWGQGLFVLTKTDLYLPGVMPIELTRTYRQGDNMSRAFGIGASHPYNVFLVGDSTTYSYADLVLSDAGRIHYTRTSPGTDHQHAITEHTGTQTRFSKSQLSANGDGWTLKCKDAMVWGFELETQELPLRRRSRASRLEGAAREALRGGIHRLSRDVPTLMLDA